MRKSPTSESGTTKVSTLKDDTSINFRPSFSNFKHMKKYLKSKFEEDMNYNTAAVSSNLNDNKKTDQKKVNVVVQPPLPPNSPPLASSLNYTVKKEVEDDEYEKSNSDQSDDLKQEEFTFLPQSYNVDGSNEDEPIMCKDFVRDKCTRGDACIYAHEIYISQLTGVYTFCKNFENGRCFRPVCHFVHATTFEKEHFLRSGELPPHALDHLNSVTTEANGNGPSGIPPINNNSFSQSQAKMVDWVCPGATPVSAALPPAVAESCAAAHETPAKPTVSSAALKREWRHNDDFVSSPRLHASDPLAKKCKRCELTEIRLQHNKAQLAQAIIGSQELDEKIDFMVKKNHRLHSVLTVLLKPTRELGHIHNNFLTTNRLSVLDDSERNKDALLSQMKVLMTKRLLRGSGTGSLLG